MSKTEKLHSHGDKNLSGQKPEVLLDVNLCNALDKAQ